MSEFPPKLPPVELPRDALALAEMIVAAADAGRPWPQVLNAIGREEVIALARLAVAKRGA